MSKYPFISLVNLTVVIALLLDPAFLGLFIGPAALLRSQAALGAWVGSTLSCTDSHTLVAGNPRCLQDGSRLGDNQADSGPWEGTRPHQTEPRTTSLHRHSCAGPQEPPPETSKDPENLQGPSSFPSPLTTTPGVI